MLRRVATLLLKIGRWDVLPDCTPTDSKYILLAAPHTSFVDGFWMLTANAHFGIRSKWLIKAKHLRGPLKLLKFAGALPIEPGANKNITAMLAEAAAGADSYAVLISPPGTRSKSDHWKSGFYRLAEQTGLPIYFSYLDYGQRRVGVGLEPLIPSGDVRKDMDVIRAFYGGMLGRYPDQTSDIALREELEPPTAGDAEPDTGTS